MSVSDSKNTEKLFTRELKNIPTEELLRAVEFYDDTGVNLSTHGQADDYTVGSLKMAELYHAELQRRGYEKKNVEEKK